MKTKINIVMVILLISILVFSAVFTTYAVSQKDLNEIDDKINETERELDEIKDNISQEMRNIQDLEGEISETQFNLTKVQSELETLQKEINKLTDEIKKKMEKYSVNYENACDRIVAQYKYGNVTYLDVLLNSTSLTNFLSNYYMVNQMLESDQSFLEDLEKEKKHIEDNKSLLEEKKAKSEEDKKQIEKQKVFLSNKKAEKQRMVLALKAEDAQLQKEKEEYYAERAQIEEQIRKQAAQAGHGGGSYSGGSLAFPCPGFSRISSRFGSRTSPLAGASSYHKGVDLAAPKGTDILAAESGTVITVKTGCTHNYGKSKSCRCGGGFGNYVMVSHGGGLVTVYAHCTSINVSVNSKVSRGDVIATVGSTGASSGYHLHFGTLLNGTYVDPAPYIGI